MPKRQFQATEGLLHDVMRKQAGTVEKAVLEAVMNAVDAGASSVEVVLEHDRILVSDDGDGMAESDVERYFEQFGLKDDDIESKEFGKFRMGRGQIFNFGVNIWRTQDNVMVIDLDHDQALVVLPDADPQQSDESILDVEPDGNRFSLDTSGLSYAWLETEDYVQGCSIEVRLYNEIDPDTKASEVRDLVEYIPFTHGVEVTINGEEVESDFEYDSDTDNAWFFIDREQYGSKTRIYNKGAFVKTESITNSAGVIITKQDLDVNFARNDILEGDELYNEVVEEYKNYTFQKITSEGDYNSSEKRWLLEMAAEDEQYFRLVRDEHILEDINGEELSLADLEDVKFTFTHRGNKQAEQAAEQSDAVFVQDDYEDLVKEVYGEENFVPYSSVIEQDMKWEMEEFDYDDLSKRRQQNFDRAVWFLEQVGFTGEVKTGYSQHAGAWRTDDNELYIDKKYLKAPKEEFILERLLFILKVAAQGHDTREEGLSEDFTFRRNFCDYADGMGEHQRALLNNNAP